MSRRGGKRIVGFGDRPPDHDVIGAGGDGLRRRDDALLIAVRRSGRANAGRQREEIVAEEALEVAGFVRAADDAGASRIARQRRETDRVLARAALQPEFVEIFRRDAGENRHGEDLRRRDTEFESPFARRVDRRTHHLDSAERVHVDDVRVRADELATAAPTVRGMSWSLRRRTCARRALRSMRRFSRHSRRALRSRF